MLLVDELSEAIGDMLTVFEDVVEILFGYLFEVFIGLQRF